MNSPPLSIRHYRMLILMLLESMVIQLSHSTAINAYLKHGAVASHQQRRLMTQNNNNNDNSIRDVNVDSEKQFALLGEDEEVFNTALQSIAEKAVNDTQIWSTLTSISRYRIFTAPPSWQVEGFKKLEPRCFMLAQGFYSNSRFNSNSVPKERKRSRIHVLFCTSAVHLFLFS